MPLPSIVRESKWQYHGLVLHTSKQIFIFFETRQVITLLIIMLLHPRCMGSCKNATLFMLDHP